MTDFFRPPEPLPSSVDIPPLPASLRHDHQVRVAMEWAVGLDEESILMITKELAGQGFVPLHAVTLEHPFALPSIALNHVGSNNDEMRAFAIEVFDVLQYHFAGEAWRDWFIAPYFAVEDDTRTSFQLGVFADDFRETVVE